MGADDGRKGSGGALFHRTDKRLVRQVISFYSAFIFKQDHQI